MGYGVDVDPMNSQESTCVSQRVACAPPLHMHRYELTLVVDRCGNRPTQTFRGGSDERDSELCFCTFLTSRSDTIMVFRKAHNDVFLVFVLVARR